MRSLRGSGFFTRFRLLRPPVRFRCFCLSCSFIATHTCLIFIKPWSDLLSPLLPPSLCLLSLSAGFQSIIELSLTHYHHSNCTVVHFVPPPEPLVHTHTHTHTYTHTPWSWSSNLIVLSSFFLFVDLWKIELHTLTSGDRFAIIQCVFVLRINSSTHCLVKQQMERISLMGPLWITSRKKQISSPICRVCLISILMARSF